MPTTIGLETPRVAWVDYAKGLCIIMVVMMHSTLGVELAAERQGFMHYVVEFARPFRMPDFFLISGLFVSLVIDRPWRLYLDRKVAHFAYFYVLWTAIQFVFKAPGIASEHGWPYVGFMYLQSFIEPFGTLWFIYLLPIFFLVTRITRQVPSTLIWIIAAALEMSHISTGWTVIDEFASRFYFFLRGLPVRVHYLRGRRKRRSPSPIGCRRPDRLGCGQRHGRGIWRRGDAGHFPRPRPCGRTRHCGVRCVVGAKEPAPRFAFRGAAIDHCLLGILPSHGIHAHRPHQEWVNRLRGGDVNHRDRDGSSRSLCDVASGDPDGDAFSVRASQAILAFVTASHDCAARRSLINSQKMNGWLRLPRLKADLRSLRS